MREILFRAKSDSTKPIWIYGSINLSYMPETNTALISNGENTYKCLPDTIGQYTGLTDKNGKKIFEGDIVERTDDKCIVRWNEKNANFIIIGGMTKLDFSLLFAEQLEIIGNIHDNTELLES